MLIQGRSKKPLFPIICDQLRSSAAALLRPNGSTLAGKWTQAGVLVHGRKKSEWLRELCLRGRRDNGDANSCDAEYHNARPDCVTTRPQAHRRFDADSGRRRTRFRGEAASIVPRGRQVIIPVIVMRCLKVPFKLPCSGIQSYQRRTIQVRPFPAPAIEIRRGRTHGYEQHSMLHIYRHESPRVRARPVDPLVSLPGIMVLLARAGHGDVNCRRRGHSVVASWKVIRHSCSQVHFALVAEAGIQLAGFSIQGK